MSTIDIDSEEPFSDHWQLIESIRDKASTLVAQGKLRHNQRLRSKKLKRMAAKDKEFVLQRIRGYLVRGQNGQPSYRLIWSKHRQYFKVKQAQ
jgi:hypothetical protein